jgi:amidase
MTRVHAFADDALSDDALSDDALSDLDAVGLVDRLSVGEVSASELVEAALARLDKVNPQLNGLAYAAFDRARAEAAHPRDGYFSGIPTFLKDNVDVEGMPTMHGTDAWLAVPKRVDGDFARMYLATGLLPLGKSQLSEFGFSASAEHPRLGVVRNPWHPDHSAGASSSGSAVFVASGVVPIAHANDGGGSIRIPAAVNGLVGLKPTRGRLAQDATMRQMPVRIVSDGVVTRSVRDTAAFYREAEKVWRNLKLPPIGDLTRPGRKRLTIAVVTESVGREVSPEAREQTLKVAALLEQLGHRVEETDAPVAGSFADDFLLYWAFLSLALTGAGKRQFGGTFDRSRLDSLTVGLARHAKRNLPRLPLAITRLAASRVASKRFFQAYDVVLTPTLAHATPQIGHLDPTADYEQIRDRLLEWVAFTPLQNATGDPAVSLPLASSADGLPLGMMFGAGAGHEATLIELAYELEAASPFARIQD